MKLLDLDFRLRKRKECTCWENESWTKLVLLWRQNKKIIRPNFTGKDLFALSAQNTTTTTKNELLQINFCVFIHIRCLWFVNCTPQILEEEWSFLPDAFVWDMMFSVQYCLQLGLALPEILDRGNAEQLRLYWISSFWYLHLGIGRVTTNSWS